MPAERCTQSLRQSIIRPFVTQRQRGRSALPSWVPVRQINDIPTLYKNHHLFIDFKAYDTIIRNEVYVSMSDPNFSMRLIRLTVATLSTGLYCVKIQKDCSDYIETQQGLRQGDVLSTLIFNVV
jgi:Reverse transcriptase (RNA-dependent DNA polymerase)